MTDEPKAYKIERVLDLLDVPEDRVEACVRELELWVHLVRLARTLPGMVAIKGHDVFLWTDDGKSVGRLHVNTPDGVPVVTASFGPDGISIEEHAK